MKVLFWILSLLCLIQTTHAQPIGAISASAGGTVFNALYLSRNTQGDLQVRHHPLTGPTRSLTTSAFDKFSPVFGNMVSELRFHNLTQNLVEICQDGRLFYYLGQPAPGGIKHVFAGCLSDFSNPPYTIIEGFQLTGLTPATTFDVQKLYAISATEPQTYSSNNLVHDAAGVIFETTDGEFKLLLHDTAVIFNTTTTVNRGFIEFFSESEIDASLDCPLCPDDLGFPDVITESNTTPDHDLVAPLDPSTPNPSTIPTNTPPKNNGAPPSTSSGYTCDVQVIAGESSHNCNINSSITDINVEVNITTPSSAPQNIPVETSATDTIEIAPELSAEAALVPDLPAPISPGGYEMSGSAFGGCQLDASAQTHPGSSAVLILAILILCGARGFRFFGNTQKSEHHRSE